MENNCRINRTFGELEKIILDLNNEILNSGSNIEEKVINVLNCIIETQNLDDYFSPIHTTLFYLIEQTNLNENKVIHLLLNKIKLDVLYNFSIKSNESCLDDISENNLILSNGEKQYFMLDEQGRMKINNNFDPNGRSVVMFQEQDEDGCLYNKKYTLDLDNGYVIKSEIKKIQTKEGERLDIPYVNIEDREDLLKESFNKLRNEIFDDDSENTKTNLALENDL